MQGQIIAFPEGGYRGEYIAEIARDYLARATIERDGVATAGGDVDDLAAIERFAVAYLRNEQDRDLAALGVHFDSFFLESSLYRESKVEAAVSAIVASGMTYEDGARFGSERLSSERTVSSPGSADRRRTTKTA